MTDFIPTFNSMPCLLRTERILFDTFWSDNFHEPSSHEILHIVNGHCELEFSDGSSFKASSGDTLLIPSGRLHRDRFERTENLDIFFISYAWDASDGFIECFTPDIFLNADEKTLSEVKLIFDMIRSSRRDGYEKTHLLNSVRLAHILALGFSLVAPFDSSSEMKHDSVPRREQLAEAAKRFIARHFRENIRLEDVAGYLHVSPSYISRILSSDCEFSFNGYLTSLRMAEARKQLLQDGCCISDLAHFLGYDDANYFSKVFRKATGVSPSRYAASIVRESKQK